MLFPERKIAYTKKGIRKILREDNNVDASRYDQAWRARNDYFAPPDDDPDFLPVHEIPDGTSGTIDISPPIVPRENTISLADLQCLANLLDRLRHTVDLLGNSTSNSFTEVQSTIRELFSRIENLEATMTSFTESSDVQATLIPSEDITMAHGDM